MRAQMEGLTPEAAGRRGAVANVATTARPVIVHLGSPVGDGEPVGHGEVYNDLAGFSIRVKQDEVAEAARGSAWADLREARRRGEKISSEVHLEV